MHNNIEHDITVYDKSNIYEFDNSIMMHYYPKRIMEILKEQGIEKIKSCLELGIGHGYSTEFFSTHIQKYTVLEGDKSIIEKFKMTYPKLPIKIINKYFEDYDTKERYDIIICGFVLEHVDNPREILKKYKKMLTPNGKIIITVPNAETLNRRIGYEAGLLKDMYELSEHDRRCGHKRYYSMKSLDDDVKNCGLKCISREGLFLKPFTTLQMIHLGLSDNVVEGLMKVGRDYPELCLGLLYVTERE